MPNVAQTNITGGEVSPTFLGRPDVARYANACLVLQNFLLTTTGMYSFRPAMRLMGFPKFDGGGIRLRTFQFSDQQGYVLELGNGYMRVWHSQGQVAGEDNLPVEIETPFPSEELPLLAFTQSADFLFVISELRGVLAIKRRSHTNWSIALFPLKDGPYGAQNNDTTRTLSLSGTTNGVSVTVTAAGFPDDEKPFGDGDAGRLIRIKDGTGPDTWRWMIVDEWISDDEVMATLQGDTALSSITAGVPFSGWRLGLYSNRLGWPATGTLHEQRLVLAGSAAIPDRLDGSAIARFDTFSPGTDADNAYGYALGSKNVNRILALGASNDLLLFTVGSEHRFAGDSTGAAITPTSVWTKPISPDGAKRIEPLDVGNSTVFVDKLGMNLRAATFNLGYQNYGTDNLTLLADHMAWLDEESPGFQDLAWQGNPIGTIWTRRGNDELAGCLFEPKEQVLGWHRHPMGMPLDGEGAPIEGMPRVLSIATMKGPTYDELWAVVERDLPGRTMRTIERMDRPGLWDAPPESQMFLDCGVSLRNRPGAELTIAAKSGNGVAFSLAHITDGTALSAADVGRFIKRRYLARYTYRGRPVYLTAIARIATVATPTTGTLDIIVPFPVAGALAAGKWGLTVSEISGLDHFNGFKIPYVSDGRVCKPKLVVDGRIALEVPGWEVSAGLPYAGLMVTLPIDPGPSPAVGQGRPVRVDHILMRLLNSIGGEFAQMPEGDDKEPRFDKLTNYKQGASGPQVAPVPFSGDKKIFVGGSWNRRAELIVRQAEPLPLNVNMMVAHVYAPFVQP